MAGESQKLAGRVALITGGGKGIGRGIALALGKEGARVGLVGRNADRLQQVCSELDALGIPCLALPADVRSRPEVFAAKGTLEQAFGPITILVNCAQDMRVGVSLEDTTDEDLALAWESGPRATIYTMQACADTLRASGGTVVNFASSAGTEGLPGFTAYAAAKEAIRAISRVAAREWGRDLVTVNVICPFANSPGIEAWAREFPDEYGAAVGRTQMGRVGDCERDLGRTVVFLCSEDGSFITGQTLMVDGGSFIHA